MQYTKHGKNIIIIKIVFLDIILKQCKMNFSYGKNADLYKFLLLIKRFNEYKLKNQTCIIKIIYPRKYDKFNWKLK